MQTASPSECVCDGFEITLYPVTLYPARSPGYELGGDMPPKAARSQMVVPRHEAGRDQEGATRVGTPRAAQNLIVSTTLLKLVAVPVATCDAHTVGYTHRDRVETV